MYSMGYARWCQQTLWNFTSGEKFPKFIERYNGYDEMEQLRLY